MVLVYERSRSIPYVQNRLLVCLIGSVNDLDTIACPSVPSLGAIAMEFGMDIIVIYGTFSIIFILLTTDVVGDNGSVNDLDTIACPSISSICAIAMEFGMDIIVIYGTFSIIFILLTTDVVSDN